MPREKKPILVRTIEDRWTGLDVELFYNPNPGKNTHQAEVGGQRFENPSLDHLEDEVRAYLRSLNDLEWFPIIAVTILGAGDTYSRYRDEKVIGFDHHRMWVAKKPDGGYRDAKWGTPEDKRGNTLSHFNWRESYTPAYGNIRKTETEFKPPCVGSYYGKVTHYFPYNEELWQGLELLAAQIKVAQAWFMELIAVENGGQLLIDAGSRVLPLLGTGEEGS
jgi:hypothetical protein